MSVDRVATSAQTAFFLSQIQNAGGALDKVQEQIASGKNANTYAGFGDKTQVLTATLAANARVSSDSGVNLDEELTALTSYQQAYAAGARLLSVVDQMYKSLLDIQ